MRALQTSKPQILHPSSGLASRPSPCDHSPPCTMADHTPESLTSPRLLTLFSCEAIASATATLASFGIFFYTTHRFGWTQQQNLLLASGQGVVYICGALLAHPLSERLGRRAALLLLYTVLALLISVPLVHPSPAIVAPVVLAYSLLAGCTWPALESLVSDGAEPAELSRRLGMYNLDWALSGAITLALCGALIQRWPPGIFAIGCAGNVICALLAWLAPPTPADTAPAAAPHAEFALLRQRRLALWLSRIAMPATYVVIYCLAALLPTLPAFSRLPLWAVTLASSIWLVARFLIFAALGLMSWWHTRPTLLMWSAILMAGAFVGILAVGQDSTAGTPTLTTIALAQVLFGITVGWIYAASLYFGMVLSEGSTEHGGYHEALIGLGQAAGPGAGALATWLFPTHSSASLIAIGGVVGLTVLATVSARLLAAKDQSAPGPCASRIP